MIKGARLAFLTPQGFFFSAIRDVTICAVYHMCLLDDLLSVRSNLHHMGDLSGLVKPRHSNPTGSYVREEKNCLFQTCSLQIGEM